MSNAGLTPYLADRPVATVLFAVAVAAWTLGELRQGLRRRSDASSADRGSQFVVRLCIVVAMGLGALAGDRFGWADLPDSVVTFGFGLLIMGTGIGVRWWCFKTLGRYFTITVMTSPEQVVIASGPYRIVRHPSYAALLLILLGLSVVVFASGASLVAVIAVSLAGLSYRIRIEEAALAATLGEPYLSYAADRKRLIPFVW